MKRSRVPFGWILSPRATLFAALVWSWVWMFVGAACRRDSVVAAESLSGAALTWAAVRYALLARTRGGAIWRLVLAKAVLSVASIACTPGASTMALALILSAVVRVPLSLILPVAMIVVVWSAIRRPAYDAADRSLIAAAVWILVPVVVEDALVVPFFVRLSHSQHVVQTLAIQQAFFAAVPGAVAAAALLRLRLRRRWLARVEAELEPSWRILGDGVVQDDLPVLAQFSPDGPRRVLARVSAAADPFRAIDRIEPVAIVGGRAAQGVAHLSGG